MSVGTSFSGAILMSLLVLACAARSETPPPAAVPEAQPLAAGTSAAAGTPRPTEPVQTGVEPRAEPTAAPSPSDAAAGGQAASPEPAPAAPSRPLSEVLSARDIAFMIDYPASAVREAAETACGAAGDDPAKRAECMTKARNDFQADVLRFRKDEQGRLFWVTYKRAGNTLTEIHTVRVELGEQTPDSITLVPKGPDTGKRLLFKGAKKITLSVPDESTLVLAEPVLGKLVYKGKIGLVGQ
jgi:hypothetical protein